MTINDEFFKKTQENLKKIKAKNNELTLKSYRINGKAEELPSTQPQQPKQPQENNVVSLDSFKKKKEELQPKSNNSELSLEERQKRITDSVQRINDLLIQLQKNNTRTSTND